MMNTPPHPAQFSIEVPADLDAIYSNFAVITHTPSEVIIDFARVLPNTPRAKVCARIINTPLHAKLLLRALSENLERYEQQFGEIKVPADSDLLAQQFFGGTHPPQPPKE